MSNGREKIFESGRKKSTGENAERDFINKEIRKGSHLYTVLLLLPLTGLNAFMFDTFHFSLVCSYFILLLFPECFLQLKSQHNQGSASMYITFETCMLKYYIIGKAS